MTAPTIRAALERLTKAAESVAETDPIGALHIAAALADLDAARAALVAAPEGSAVPVPLNADMAAGMVLLGDAYLREHAPERLRPAARATLLSQLSAAAPVPVPVSERLPGPEDCDKQGRCWFLRFPFDYSRESWSLEDRTYRCNAGFTHWLPHHALPVPTTRKEENLE